MTYIEELLHTIFYHASMSSSYFKEQRNSVNINIYNTGYIMLLSTPRMVLILGAIPNN